MVESRFSGAIRRFPRTLYRKWWVGLLFIILELIRDRAAAWANSQIDDKRGWFVEVTASLASSPFSWTVAAAVLVLAALFVHSYVFDKRSSGAAKTQVGTADPDSVRPTRGAFARYLAVPPEQRFIILNAMLGLSSLREPNPRLIMHFTAYNAHYHTIEVTGVRGRFKMSGQEMAGEIELRGGNNGVTYGDETRFSIQQWVSQTDVERILTEDQYIVIQVNVLDIRAEAIDPTTAETVGEFRVALPSQLQFAKANGWGLSPLFNEQATR